MIEEDAINVLKSLPIMTKEILRKDIEIIEIESRKSVGKNFTSGTSGTPFVSHYDEESLGISFALLDRFYYNCGLPKKFKSVRFSGRIMFSNNHTSPPFWLHNYHSNQLFMSTYHLLDKNMSHYISKLIEFKADLIDGYPSAIYVIAKYINVNKISLDYTPIAICTTAETLYDYQRAEITQAFGCKVFNQYASSEGGAFITECNYGRLHINTDSGYFEFFNKSGSVAKAGEYAEMIITSFRTLKTPLIRYKTGDWVKLPDVPNEECECGCKMPFVDKIIGREDDLLYTEERGYVGRMDPAYKGVNGIEKSQLIQISLDKLLVKQVVNKSYSIKDEENLLKNLRDRLGSNISIEIEYLDTLPLGPNGKFDAVKRLFDLDLLNLS
jgi:phenylacetate-CoA ligase